MSESDPLEAEVLPWLRECGSCDAALPMGCTCQEGDFRNTMLKLWRAYENLRDNSIAIVDETDRKFVFNGDEAGDVWVDRP